MTEEPRTRLYVVSSRKPDDNYNKVSPLRPFKREAYLHVPKRAGTFALFTAPFEKEGLEEADLTPVRDRDGWPLDTDRRDSLRSMVEATSVEREAKLAQPQHHVEDQIATVLAGLGTPLLLFVHGYNVTPGESLRSG